MKIKWIGLLLVLTLIHSSLSIAQPTDPNKVNRVAILPFVIHSEENLDYLREGIYDILTSRITAAGKIVVVERSAVERAIYEERPTRLDEDVAKRIGMRAGADYIVLGSLTKIGNYISLDARMISVTEEKPPLTAFTQHKGLDDVMVKIGDFAQEIGMKILGRAPMPSQSADSRRSPLIQSGRAGVMDRGLNKSQTFSFEVKGVDAGDLDGDRKNELVVMSTNSLYIFKYSGEKLTLSQKLELEPGNEFLTLDVADVNRNGYAEIIVTNMVSDHLRSFILEFEEGKFRKIAEEKDWYFRVLDHPKDGPVLMAQLMGSEGIYAGPIYRMVWSKKSYERGPKMPFPRETILFGVGLVEARKKGTLDTLIIDDYSRLRIIEPDGKSAWYSKDRFGGSNNFYETRKKADIIYKGARDAPSWRVYIPGRIVVRDLDRDGVPEVIVNKNNSSTYSMFGNARTFDSGEVHDLVWEENTFVTNWKTREIAGYIADFQVKDVDNDGEDELVVAVVNPSGALEKKSTSNILIYKLF